MIKKEHEILEKKGWYLQKFNDKILLRNKEKRLSEEVANESENAANVYRNWNVLISTLAWRMGYNLPTKKANDIEIEAFHVNIDLSRNRIMISNWNIFPQLKVIDTREHAEKIIEILLDYEGKIFGVDLRDFKCEIY